MRKMLSDNWELITVLIVGIFMMKITGLALSREVVHTGKCLEYKTEYKLDCGLFVSKDSFCTERKYDVCVRWEEENNE